MVCQARAVGDGRFGIGRFADPVAAQLLRPDERAVVEQVRAERTPADWRDRIGYGLLEAVVPVLVTRTTVIDEAVRAQGNPQLVVLGAGLDARAWRMPDLAGVEVFEVDHPASQQDKRDRVDGLEPLAKSLTYVPVDFARDSLGDALAQAGHRESLPTTWIWEGVLPYLTQPAVDATLTSLTARSAPASRLIATYSLPNRFHGLGRRILSLSTRLAGRQDPLEHEKTVSAWTPEQMRTLLSHHGFTVTADDDLSPVAEQLGLSSRRWNNLGRVVVADLPKA